MTLARIQRSPRRIRDPLTRQLSDRDRFPGILHVASFHGFARTTQCAMDFNKPVKKKRKNIRVVYAAVALRRATHDQLLWQAPLVAFTSQAFLLNIAFGDGANTFCKVFSGLLATGLGLLSWRFSIAIPRSSRKQGKNWKRLKKSLSRTFQNPNMQKKILRQKASHPFYQRQSGASPFCSSAWEDWFPFLQRYSPRSRRSPG